MGDDFQDISVANNEFCSQQYIRMQEQNNSFVLAFLFKKKNFHEGFETIRMRTF